MSLRSRACTVLLLCAAVWQTASAADFKIGIEPSYPREQAQEIYKPLLQYLGKTTGHNFILVVPRNYHFLWRDLRQNAPLDFAFEEAHFVDYRAKRHGFEPLVRTIEPTNYTLLAQPDLAENGLNGLVGRRIACMPSPSLGFALVAEMFKNPVAQPDIRSEAASWRDGVEMVFAGEADAAMVQTYIADAYPNLVAVNKTRDFPGRAVSAAASVDPAVKQAVKDALLKLHEDPDQLNTLNELGTAQFQETSAAEYAGAEQMLSGFFGYTAPPGATPPPATPPPATPPSGAPR
jgi:ABC-type phosphate/phosphonate transport system substrate-binding protein